MPEQEMNSAAAKFISSLVKSLQILCNGHVEFSESIELVGHINVKIDHKLKFDYIVDEQVSKEGQDSSTTFLSNSYHSCPPSRLQRSKQGAETGKGCTIRGTMRPPGKSLQDSCDKYSDSNLAGGDPNIGIAEQKRDYSVSVEESSSGKDNQMIVKLEEDSDDCMVLPASPGEYEAVPETSDIEHEVFPAAGPSGSFDDTQGPEYDNYSGKGNTSGPPGKRRKTSEKGAVDCLENKGEEEGEGSTPGGKRSASELIGKFAAYECSYCSVILTEYDDLSLHSKSCPSPSCSMICLTCGEKFPNKPDMRQHLKFVHSHKTFGCKFCDMMFLSSSGLLSHTKAKHKPDPKTLCQICGQAFHNKANLEGHMNMHLGIRPFKCKKCGKSYGHSKSLITHEKSCKSIATVGDKVKSSGTPLRKSVNSGVKTASSGAAPQRTPKHPEKKRTSVEENVSNITVSESDQSFTFNETYQTYEECENKKELCNNERNLQLLQNASQPFTFTEPFHQVFHEASPHAMSVPSASNPSSVSESVGNTVYGPTSATFVLPQVAYGMYPQGMMPDQR